MIFNFDIFCIKIFQMADTPLLSKASNGQCQATPPPPPRPPLPPPAPLTPPPPHTPISLPPALPIFGTDTALAEIFTTVADPTSCKKETDMNT